MNLEPAWAQRSSTALLNANRVMVKRTQQEMMLFGWTAAAV
jgi:hypothetical protein